MLRKRAVCFRSRCPASAAGCSQRKLAHVFLCFVLGLCALLEAGAPTGVGKKIPASGVWPLLDTEDPVEGAIPDLVLGASNHKSAGEVEKVRALVDMEVQQGYMQRIGSLEQVKQRFPSDKLAIGKLGVVSCEGKDDRLIGESRASGASRQRCSASVRKCQVCTISPLLWIDLQSGPISKERGQSPSHLQRTGAFSQLT